MMSKKMFVISLIVFGLLLQCFSFIVYSDGISISSNDFFLKDYKEKAELGDSHVLNIGFDSKKVIISKSDVSYKIVGSPDDIKAFNDAVNVSYKIVSGEIQFIGKVLKWGVYNVDIIPVIKTVELKQWAWWNSSWGYRYDLYIDYTQVAQDFNYYPILVNISSDANLSANCQSNGNDISFVDTTNTTEFPHQIELFNGTSGELVAWVNVTDVHGTTTSNTHFNLYFGNSGEDDVNYLPNLVFDNNYTAVYHLNESTGNAKDWSANSNDGTFAGDLPDVARGGKIGNGQDMDGTGDTIDLPDNFDNVDVGSIEGWIFSDNVGTYQDIFGSSCGTTVNYLLIEHKNTGVIQCSVYDGGGRKIRFYTNSAITQSKWYHYAFVVGTGYNKFYLNGMQVPITYDGGDSGSQYFFNEVSGAQNTKINSFWYDGTEYNRWNGVMDETRISTLPRSQNWYLTHYNNVVNASTFIIIGQLQSYLAPTSLPNVTSISIGNNSNSVSICENISFVLNDDDGDKIYYTIQGNNRLCSQNGGVYNCTLWYNCTNCKWLGWNYTIWVNVTNNNITYHRYYYEFRTETLNSYITDTSTVNIDIGSSTLSIIIPLVLFLFFFSIGYRENKRSGGAFVILSGFMFIALEILIGVYLNAVYVLPLITPFAIFIILVGIRKFLFFVEGDKSKSEGE